METQKGDSLTSFMQKNFMATHNSFPCSTPPKTPTKTPSFIHPNTQRSKLFPILNPRIASSLSSTTRRRRWAVGSLTEDKRTAPKEGRSIRTDQDQGEPFLADGSQGFEEKGGGGEEDNEMLASRAINAAIVLGFGSLAVTRLLTVDHDYWHGWTLYEVLRYAPEHNWIAYEEALKANPVLAKMAISGIVYSLGDWIAQCVEGKPLFEFDRTRMFRSGLVGFTLHGSLSHYYYQFCEALIPFKDWWVVPAKVAFDQTIWAALWNSIYFVVLGCIRLESPATVFSELKSTFWPMLTAGWKLWPFAHLITYGVVPVEQRLLWVDCVELIWVTILSTLSNEKSEARITVLAAETDSNPPEVRAASREAKRIQSFFPYQVHLSIL